MKPTGDFDAGCNIFDSKLNHLLSRKNDKAAFTLKQTAVFPTKHDKTEEASEARLASLDELVTLGDTEKSVLYNELFPSQEAERGRYRGLFHYNQIE